MRSLIISFFLPRALAMARVDRVENVAHFLVNRLAEIFRGELQAGLDQAGVLFDGEIGVLILVVENPALPLGDDLVPEFLRSPVRNPTCGKRPR